MIELYLQNFEFFGQGMWGIAAKNQVLVFSYLIQRMYRKKIEKDDWDKGIV